MPNQKTNKTHVLINRTHFSFLKASNILRRVDEDLQKRRHRTLMTSSSNRTSDKITEAMARVERLELHANRLEEHLDALGISLSRSNVSKRARTIAAERKHHPDHTGGGFSHIFTLQEPSKNKQKLKSSPISRHQPTEKAANSRAKRHQSHVSEHAAAPKSNNIPAKIIDINGLRSDQIAIFILSAGTNNVRWKQAQEKNGRGASDNRITYYHTRALPAIDTFGQYFPHLYFVFAGDSRAHAERKIYHRCPIVEKTHDRSIVYCDQRYILVGNRCKNQRKGFLGPCCRLEISLDFFLDNMDSTFKAVQWWIFSDDDVYFRPHALVAALSTYDPARPLNVAGSYPSMFGFGATKLKDTQGDLCGDKNCVHW